MYRPVLFHNNEAHFTEEFKQYKDLVAVLAGDKDDTTTWRLGFVTKKNWKKHTKMINGVLHIDTK